MTALALNVNLAPTGGEFRRLPSEISANPFQGSLLSYAADGYVHELVAGEPFAGICRQQIQTPEIATADGSRAIEATAGTFTITATLSGVAQDDVLHGRRVFASDDATITFTPTGNTLIGRITGLEGSKAIITCQTLDHQAVAPCSAGTVAKAATGALTITTADLNKLIKLPSTGAQAVTLPAAADCAGQFLTFKKTTADAVAATLTAAGSDTIDGASTVATIDAAQDTITLTSDGVLGWWIIAQKIA
jgi:hypothetical protein